MFKAVDKQIAVQSKGEGLRRREEGRGGPGRGRQSKEGQGRAGEGTGVELPAENLSLAASMAGNENKRSTAEFTNCLRLWIKKGEGRARQGRAGVG